MVQTTLHITSTRMLELIELLKTNGQISTTQEFLDVIGMKKQNIRIIKLGDGRFTPEQIRLACKTYKVSADWIFGLKKEKFR